MCEGKWTETWHYSGPDSGQRLDMISLEGWGVNDSESSVITL